MTDLQKAIASELINLYWYGMKNKPTGFTFQNITYSILRIQDKCDKTEFEYELEVVKDKLIKMGILKKSIGFGETYQLTEKGRKYRF